MDWGQAETEPLMEQVQDASQGSGQAACGMSRADGVTSSSAGAHEHGPMAHSFVLGPGRDVRVQGVSALHGCVTPAAPNRLPSPLAPPGPAAWRHKQNACRLAAAAPFLSRNGHCCPRGLAPCSYPCQWPRSQSCVRQASQTSVPQPPLMPTLRRDGVREGVEWMVSVLNDNESAAARNR